MQAIYKIQGMMCKHCAARVQKAIEALPGVTTVVIDLDRATATVDGDALATDVMAAVSALGYGIDLA